MANTHQHSAWAGGGAEGASVNSDSGIHIAPAALARRIEEALTSSSRTEAALADLLRTAQFLCATVRAVCQTNGELACELNALRHMVVGEGLGIIDVCSDAFEQRERSHAADALPREELIAEHDQFIAMLLAEHEREVEALRHKLAETQASLQARDTTAEDTVG